MICGRKTSTPPTPAMAPSASISPSQPGTRSRTPSPSQPNSESSASAAGAASVKMAWKNASITSANTTTPSTGCSSTASMRRVRRSAPGGRYATASTDATHAERAAAPSGGAITGRCHDTGSASSARTESSPTPRWPITPTTGMPMARPSRSTSMEPPRAATSSIIVTTKHAGRPSRSSSATNSSERSSVDASATITNASGRATPSITPSSESATICSSGLIAASP